MTAACGVRLEPQWGCRGRMGCGGTGGAAVGLGTWDRAPELSPHGARWQHQPRLKVLLPAGLAVPPSPDRLLRVTFALGCAITRHK